MHTTFFLKKKKKKKKKNQRLAAMQCVATVDSIARLRASRTSICCNHLQYKSEFFFCSSVALNPKANFNGSKSVLDMGSSSH